MSQSGHAPRRPLRRARGEPRRVLPHLVRLRGRWSSACSSGCAPPGRTGSPRTRSPSRPGPSRSSSRRWAWGADVHDLVELDGERIKLFDDVAGVLLDADRPEYLGGQFLHAAIGSLDFGGLPEVFRTGQPLADRPDRYRVAIERLTVQDVAVFFQEALAALPQLVVDLQGGA